MPEKPRSGIHRIGHSLATGSLAGVLVISACGGSPQTAAEAPPNTPPARPSANATVGWSQQYTTQPDGNLNTTIWNAETGNNNGWGNGEVQFYSKRAENVRVAGGDLVLQARPERYRGFAYTSARITTKEKFSFTYGRLRIVAKLPTSAGVWPALWLMPEDNKYGNVPIAPADEPQRWLANGELDIAEGSAQGDNMISGSAHALHHYPGHHERTGTADIADPNAYHSFELDKTPDQIIYSVDGHPYFTLNNPHTSFADWPYDQPYYLIINIALGGSMSENLRGTYPPDGINTSGAPWTMRIRSIDYFPQP
ncbi:MAG TPA: glycoside hydrolase family 16 protein [Candidatus Saccharimonadales bacterium]|nr:glycoside hydrolase family 16 protein [Candidatus Saccharimonadales bacterium]